MRFDKFLAGEISIDNLEGKDIVEFFSVEQEESQHLEFKSYSQSPQRRVKILPQIADSLSAFSNSDGGVLIWGSPIEQLEKDKSDKVIRRYCKGEVQGLPLTDLDSIGRGLRDKLSPTISHLRVKDFRIGEKMVVVFEVKESDIPIMSSDKSFWIRNNFEKSKASFAMVDYLFRKRKYPDLFLKVSSISQSFPKVGKINLRIDFEVFNNSPGVSAHLAHLDIMTKSGHFPPIHPNEKSRLRLMQLAERKFLPAPLNSGIRIQQNTTIQYDNAKDIDEDEIVFSLAAVDTPIKISSIKLSSEIDDSFEKFIVTSQIQEKNRIEDVYKSEIHQELINDLRPD